MKLSLHLGAHKTATTYLQKRFVMNKAVLEKRGVLVIPLEELRDNFSITILDVAPRKNAFGRFLSHRKARSFLKRKLAGRASDDAPLKRVIISDENLTGTPRRMVTSGRLYPQLAENLALVREFLDGFDIEIFFSIRHQGTFASSIFAETLRHPSSTSFNEAAFRVAWMAGEPSWTPVIGDISRVFPHCPLTVWDYDDFTLLERVVMSRMCGYRRSIRFPRRRGRTRETFSQKAVEELLRVQDEEGPAARRAKMRDIRLRYPRGDDYPPYSLWTEDQLAAQGELFEQDLQAIAGIGGKVRLLKPKRAKREASPAR